MINRDSAIPMYEQIASILRADIKQDPMSGGKCLETHQEMAVRFGVSMITVRKAVQKLVDEGVLVIRQGKGTFIREPILRDELGNLTGVSNIMAKYNVKADVVVKTMSFISTPQDITEVAASLGNECLYIERLHLVDRSVIGYAKLYLPVAYGSKLTRNDVESHTIYHLYKNKLGVELGKGVQVIRADQASPELAGVLQVPAGTPVLRIQRSAYSAAGEIIEYMELFYEYNNYAFSVELALDAEMG